jgi:serine O-acetyltransferase
VNEPARSLLRVRRARQPRFVEAVLADACATAAYRGERAEFRSRPDAVLQALRLVWVSDAFLGQVLYRARASLQVLGVPVLPRLLHRLAMVTAQVCIGDPVIVRPGLYLAHGQVVIDGLSEVAEGVVIFPFVTIGLKAGNFEGPTIGPHVTIGTGAKVIGPVHIGAGARIGANAVVVHDVPSGATVAGVPAGHLYTTSGGSASG